MFHLAAKCLDHGADDGIEHDGSQSADARREAVFALRVAHDGPKSGRLDIHDKRRAGRNIRTSTSDFT